MRLSKLTKIDLILLVVLEGLLQVISVGRSADRLNLSSSAVSHALRRLRTLFDNELLVRQGRTMIPTARAKALEQALPGALATIAHLLEDPSPFDPATSTRVFHLVAPDFVTPLILSLLEETAHRAPGIAVEMAPFTSASISEMKLGRHDVLIAPSTLQDNDLRGQVLGRWPWAVFGRAAHPAFRDWSLETWASYPHLQVRTTGSTHGGPVDTEAVRRGITRRVGATVPHFSVAAPALAQTDMLLTVPSVVLGSMAAAFDLDHRPAPLDLAPLELSLFHSVSTGDAADVRWFVAQVLAACSDLQGARV